MCLLVIITVEYINNVRIWLILFGLNLTAESSTSIDVEVTADERRNISDQLRDAQASVSALLRSDLIFNSFCLLFVFRLPVKLNTPS